MPLADVERARRLLAELEEELERGLEARQLQGEKLPGGSWKVQLRYMPLADLVALHGWARRMDEALNGSG